MATKEAYRKKYEAQLSEWDAKLDLLNAKARKASADARIGYENQLASLRAQRAEAHKRFEEFGKRSENAWEDMRAGMDKVWGEMGKAMQKVTAHFK